MDLVALVFNVSQIQTVEKGGRIICLRKAKYATDATDDISLTLFGSMVDVIKRKIRTCLQTYECQNANLQDF